MNFLLFKPATRVWACVGYLLLLAGAAAAQTTDPAPVEVAGIPLDDITNREVVADHRALRYAPIRESDILWEKRLWRVIDVREKMNLPFAYPGAPLAQILGEAALDDHITVYDPGDDRFSQPLRDQALRDALFKTDTIITVDVETGEEIVKVVTNAPDWSAVKRFRIKESWFFDTRTGTLRFRILGIAPLMNVSNSEGDFLYERPMFWVHYPGARTFLAQQKAYTPGGNMSSTITWEDLFEMRHFASVVTRDNNLYDRRIEDYLGGTAALYEAKNINDALLNREHDLWSW